MRFFALTLFGIYQLGRASHKQAANGGATAHSPISGGDAALTQEKMLKIETALEHLDIPRGYIEACFSAIGMEAGSSSDLMPVCIAGMDAQFAHEIKLKNFKTILEKLRESLNAKELAEIKTKKYQEEIIQAKGKLVMAELEPNRLRRDSGVEAAADKVAKVEPEEEELASYFAKLEQAGAELEITGEIERLNQRLEKSKIAEAGARHAHETELLHLKAALEDLHVPDYAIKSCLTQMGLDKDHSATLMRIARQESSPADGAILKYERTLEKLRKYYGNNRYFEPCLRGIEFANVFMVLKLRNV
jgi:hypothetical protein